MGQSNQHKKALVPIVAFTFPARAVVVVRTAGKSRDLQGGDATRKRLLEAAGLARARVIAITFDHHKALERVLHYARQENPNVATIVSAADDRDLPALVTAGVGTVFPENFAAGFGFADQVLLLSGFSQEDAADVGDRRARGAESRAEWTRRHLRDPYPPSGSPHLDSA